MTSEPERATERVARLIGLLRPAPDAWIQAAKELPTARAALDGIVERAQADRAYRAAVLADLERALTEAPAAHACAGVPSRA